MSKLKQQPTAFNPVPHGVATGTASMTLDGAELVSFDLEPDSSLLDPIIWESVTRSGETGAHAFTLHTQEHFFIKGATWDACAAMHEVLEGAHAFRQMCDDVADVTGSETAHTDADERVRDWLQRFHGNPGFVTSLANVLLCLATGKPIAPRVHDPSAYRFLSDDYRRTFPGVTVDESSVLRPRSVEPWPTSYPEACDLSEQRSSAFQKLWIAESLVERTKTLSEICSDILCEISPPNQAMEQALALVDATRDGLVSLEAEMEKVSAAISKIGRASETTEGECHE
jgi:hypothetical protein